MRLKISLLSDNGFSEHGFLEDPGEEILFFCSQTSSSNTLDTSDSFLVYEIPVDVE